MEYTKGKWKAYKNALGTWAVSTDLEPIAQVLRHYNAHLISAAPEMYEACKIALLLSEQPILQGNADVQMLTNTLKKALAKAEDKT